MKIVSFNTAAWNTTVERIKKHFGTLETWLDRHAVDILCLQETKISKEDLEMNALKLGALNEKYDTFWAYMQLGSQQKKGLNGVATFSRKGRTVKATAQIFQESVLDSEGRCIMTDHGNFVIFNVYVPFSGVNYGRLAFKMKLLKSLRIAMHKQRALGKKVILVGDLNITLRGIDTTREARCIYIERILKEHQYDFSQANNYCLFHLEQNDREKVNRVVKKLMNVWPTVRNALISTLETEQGTDQKYFNSAINYYGNRVRLGKKSFNEPVFEFKLDGYMVDGEVGKERYLARPSGALMLENLKEAVTKLKSNNNNNNNNNSGNNNDSDLSRECSISSEEWNLIGDVFGEPKHSPCTVNWLRALLEEDGMIDTFSSSHPYAQCRYTCWNQQENCRYSNDGSRLDHILIDKSMKCIRGDDLVGYVSEEEERRQKHGDGGGGGGGGGEKELLILMGNHNIEQNAALRACTANFLFQQAPTEGGGIPEAVKQAYEHQFTSGNGSNIVYTPPEYSDHVAVQCVLSDEDCDEDFIKGKLILQKDKETRLCQPHVTQPMISSFFSTGSKLSTANKNVLPSSAAISMVKSSKIYDGSGSGSGSGSGNKKRNANELQEKKNTFFVAKKKNT